jgi:hypothetical protein
MARNNVERPPSGPEPQPLSVLRVGHGQKHTVWCFSRAVNGLRTHYHKGRSHLCLNQICPPAVHTVPITWKGYIAAAVWTLPEGLWRPIVLEVTEALELDFRGLYARGQVWDVFCPHKTGKANPAVRGRLATVGEGPVPEAFSCLEVLRHLYHVEHVELNVANALPPRQLMEPIRGPSPRAAAKSAAEDAPMSPEEWASIRAKMGLEPRPAPRSSEENGQT